MHFPGWWAATPPTYCPTGEYNIPNLRQPNPVAWPPWSTCIWRDWWTKTNPWLHALSLPLSLLLSFLIPPLWFGTNNGDCHRESSPSSQSPSSNDLIVRWANAMAGKRNKDNISSLPSEVVRTCGAPSPPSLEEYMTIPTKHRWLGVIVDIFGPNYGQTVLPDCFSVLPGFREVSISEALTNIGNTCLEPDLVILEILCLHIDTCTVYKCPQVGTLLDHEIDMVSGWALFRTH